MNQIKSVFFFLPGSGSPRCRLCWLRLQYGSNGDRIREKLKLKILFNIMKCYKLFGFFFRRWNFFCSLFCFSLGRALWLVSTIENNLNRLNTSWAITLNSAVPHSQFFLKSQTEKRKQNMLWKIRQEQIQIRENKIKCQKNIIICESKLWASQAM